MAAARGTFAKRAFRFYTGLIAPRVPRGVTVMNPFSDARVRKHLRLFLDKYFDDDRPRTLVFGINPGRFGAGITGVTFTDPAALAELCGIPNDLPRLPELSSVFIYKFIEQFGGPRLFYRDFFLTAVCPLGFTRNGVNLNYYDDRALERSVTPFIIDTIRQQIAMGGRVDRAIVLGIASNLKFLRELNATHGFFRELIPLEHPRWIMQYRRRKLDEYIARYQEVFSSLSGSPPPDVPPNLLPGQPNPFRDIPTA